LPRNVKVLAGTSLLNDVASEMVYPLVPEFLATVGGTRLHLGLIEGLVESVSSILKLFSGGWSDRAGRRKGFVLVGYALSTVARPLIALVAAPWQLLLARLGDRVAKGIRTSPRDALIADSTPPGIRGRAFGFHRAMDHVGAAIGPLLAMGFLWFWPGQYRTLFLLTLVPGLLVVALLVFGLREPASASSPKERFRPTLKPFDRNFKLYLLALAIFTLGNSSDMFLLERARELGVPGVLIPLLWCLFSVVKGATNLLFGPLADRLGPRPQIFAGWLIYAAIYLALAFATTAWHVWALLLGYAIFYGLTEPAEKTIVANLVPPEHRGLGFGWFNFAIGLTALPSSLIFGWLYHELGGLVAFGWGAALAFIAAILLFGVRTTRAA
jgi:MFS family permease